MRRTRGDQIHRVARLIQLDPQMPTVLMGDFNATPDKDVLDPIYAPTPGDGAHGFREVDDLEGDERPCRCGEPTFEHLLRDPKIDYIFLTGRTLGFHAMRRYPLTLFGSPHPPGIGVTKVI